MLAEHGSALLAYLVSKTGNLADAEDLFQETAVKIFKDLRRSKNADQIHSPIAYMIVIARRTAYDFFRKRDRRSEVSFNEEYKSQSWDEPLELETIIFKEKQYQEIESGMAKLHPQQASLLREVYFEGVTQTSVAKREGVSDAAVSGRISRARHQLRRKVRQRLEHKLPPRRPQIIKRAWENFKCSLTRWFRVNFRKRKKPSAFSDSSRSFGTRDLSDDEKLALATEQLAKLMERGCRNPVSTTPVKPCQKTQRIPKFQPKDRPWSVSLSASNHKRFSWRRFCRWRDAKRSRFSRLREPRWQVFNHQDARLRGDSNGECDGAGN